MGYQQLQGVLVEPLGVTTVNRFVGAPGFNTPSRAFGGWIYNASVEVGFSQQPTAITLDITLDAQDGQYVNNTADFDIRKEDLMVSAPAGLDGYYSITLGTKVYKPMFLSSYEVSASTDSKTLKVKFVDYSIILDKIYIALFKKQDFNPIFNKTFCALPEINGLCPGCALDDASFYKVSVNTIGGSPMVININSAAYFYNYKNPGGFNFFNVDNARGNNSSKINGLIPAALSNFWPGSLTSRPELYKDYYLRTFDSGSDFSEWNSNSKRPSNGNYLDVNGGTVVLGTEEFNQSVCGSAAEVSYNLTELITILAKAGLNFSQVNSLNHLSSSSQIFPINKNKNYRKNYTGTLREVLGNWCADFALDFYIDGTRIHFIDLSVDGSATLEQDIRDITKITSLDGPLGKALNSETRQAIGSFSESADVGDTYVQSMITFKVKPKKTEERSREKKNHCGFLAMHPLDLLNPNIASTNFLNMYDKSFNRPVLLSNIWGGLKKHWFTNRSFPAIDKCAAIGKYSSVYRNIYAGSLACNAPSNIGSSVGSSSANSQAMDGFNSFAFIPLYKLESANDEQARLDLIEKAFKANGSEQRYVVDHNAFDIWVGFRNEQEADEIIQWEKAIAESMYKYGVLVKGPGGYYDTNGTPLDAPFVSEDFATQAGTTAGLTAGSLKLLKVTNSSTPGFGRYRFFDDVPFKDIFKSPAEFLNTIVRNLPISPLDNDWGTAQESFDEGLRIINHASAGCSNYGQPKILTAYDPNVAEDGSEKPPDSFSVADFQPKFEDLPDDIFEDDNFGDLKAVLISNPTVMNGLLGKLLKTQKQISTAAGPIAYTQAQCPKLQLMIIPRVAAGLANLNPHLTVTFGFGTGENDVQLRAIYKKRYLEAIERSKEFRKTQCDYSLEEIICNIGVATDAADCAKFSATTSDCACVTPINDDTAGQYFVGFKTNPPNSASLCPARKITISIGVHQGVSNYIGVNSIIKPLANGGVGFLAEDEDYPPYTPMTASSSIVYPRQSDSFNFNGYNVPTNQSHLYQGVLTQSATFQLRNSETIECHGKHWSSDTNVSKIQLINNEVAQEIDQIVDPNSGGFYSPIYDMNGNQVLSIAAYHALMLQLSDPFKTSHTLPARTMNFEVIGNALTVSALAPYLFPHRGLKSLSFSLSPEGFRSNLSFSNRSLKLPKPEAIMNKIRATF